MFTIIGILIIVVCILLALVVLIQNPKGGGLTATFGGVGNQILGANRSTDIVEKATWYLAAALILLSLGAIFVLPSSKDKSAPTQEQSEVEKALKNGTGISPITAPATQTPTPAQTAPAAQTPEASAPASATPEASAPEATKK